METDEQGLATEPVLFDTREQAEAWALEQGFVGREFATEAV